MGWEKGSRHASFFFSTDHEYHHRLSLTELSLSGRLMTQGAGTAAGFFGTFTLQKLENFKQAHALNTVAWNCFPFVGFKSCGTG